MQMSRQIHNKGICYIYVFFKSILRFLRARDYGDYKVPQHLQFLGLVFCKICFHYVHSNLFDKVSEFIYFAFSWQNTMDIPMKHFNSSIVGHLKFLQAFGNDSDFV